jgi:hypothetical protein
MSVEMIGGRGGWGGTEESNEANCAASERKIALVSYYWSSILLSSGGGKILQEIRSKRAPRMGEGCFYVPRNAFPLLAAFVTVYSCTLQTVFFPSDSTAVMSLF